MPEDKKLIQDLTKGKQEAFKQLYLRYYPQMVGYAEHLLKDQEVARGICQDVFVKLWENRAELPAIKSLKAYLFTTVNHKALNYLRDTKLHQALLAQEQPAWLNQISITKEPSPFLKIALKEAIDRLPPKAKLCFVQTQIDGLPIKQVANNLEISQKTVENQLGRARKILRKRLKNFQ